VAGAPLVMTLQAIRPSDYKRTQFRPQAGIYAGMLRPCGARPRGHVHPWRFYEQRVEIGKISQEPVNLPAALREFPQPSPVECSPAAIAFECIDHELKRRTLSCQPCLKNTGTSYPQGSGPPTGQMHIESAVTRVVFMTRHPPRS